MELNQEGKVLQDIFELIQDWVKEGRNPEAKVIDYHKPEELREKLNLGLGSEGSDGEMLVQVREYLKYAVRTNHSSYLNQLFGGFNFPAFIGEVITSLTNTSMYTYEVAPVATLMEKEIIQKMISYTGWKTGEGALMTGGSNTNLVAMLVARNTKFPEAKLEGLSALPKLAIFVSERSHFSMLKGANTIGVGQNGVFKVALDANGRMRGDALENAIQKALSEGFTPLMICCTSGTTETGSFDAIDEAADVAQRHNIWLHVDGSWGGSAILSAKRQYLFDGLDRADSFSWNPHKLMNIPLVCSALLIKSEGTMGESIRTHAADYIYHENDTSEYDFGPNSLQCGRRVDSLKLWLAWKYFGDNGYASRIEHLFDLASRATQIVEESPELELMFTTESLNVNFRFITPEGIDSDRFNESLRYRLLKNGKAMVNYCRLDSGLSIRLILLNPDLTSADIKQFFNLFIEEGKALLKEHRSLTA